MINAMAHSTLTKVASQEIKRLKKKRRIQRIQAEGDATEEEIDEKRLRETEEVEWK